MCSPAIVFIILKISHVFPRYRSIAGKHIKNRPQTLKFRGFLQNLFGRFPRLAVHIYLENHSVCPLVRIGTPHPLSCKQFDRVGGPNSDDWRKGLALCLLCGLSKIRENIHIKKGIKIGLDYRCILPVLRKNHTCVIPVSNF
jgi:hypothetical protein